MDKMCIYSPAECNTQLYHFRIFNNCINVTGLHDPEIDLKTAPLPTGGLAHRGPSLYSIICVQLYRGNSCTLTNLRDYSPCDLPTR